MTKLSWFRDWAGGGGWTAEDNDNRYWITGVEPALHATALPVGETTKAMRKSGDLGFANTLEEAQRLCERHSERQR